MDIKDFTVEPNYIVVHMSLFLLLRNIRCDDSCFVYLLLFKGIFTYLLKISAARTCVCYNGCLNEINKLCCNTIVSTNAIRSAPSNSCSVIEGNYHFNTNFFLSCSYVDDGQRSILPQVELSLDKFGRGVQLTIAIRNIR